MHDNSIAVARVSFSQATYFVAENNKTLRVTILRTEDIESSVVVLVTNHPYESTATGKVWSSPPYALF